MDDPFIHIDREKLSQQLNLVEHGKAQGALELPTTDMQVADVHEAEIQAVVLDHFNRAQVDTENAVRAYDSRLNGLALLSNLSSIKNEAIVALGEFKRQVIVQRDRLTTSRDAIQDSYTELRDFRSKHKLSRAAHDVPHKMYTIGSMAVFWICETIANSMFLRLGDSMGWFGGVIAAAVVGALNVGIAGLFGRMVFPLTNHVDRNRRLIGAWATGVWVAATLAWNLLAGHYRDAKALGLANPESAALAMFPSWPDSIYSWGLLVAGIAFAVGAFLSGYKMDDPYPDYGPIFRRHAERCSDYSYNFEDAIDELAETRDEAIGEATDVRSELSKQLTVQRQVLSHRASLLARYEQYATNLEATANALIQEYRSANRSTRSTEAPAYFTGSWTMPRHSFPMVEVSSVSQEQIDDVEKKLEAAVYDVSNAFEDAITSFETLEHLKRSIENDQNT